MWCLYFFLSPPRLKGDWERSRCWTGTGRVSVFRWKDRIECENVQSLYFEWSHFIVPSTGVFMYCSQKRKPRFVLSLKNYRVFFVLLILCLFYFILFYIKHWHCLQLHFAAISAGTCSSSCVWVCFVFCVCLTYTLIHSSEKRFD